MSHLTEAQRTSFADNGCLIVHDVLTPEQIRAAQDALWEGIEAQRDDPATWIGAGPRAPVSGDHHAIRAALHESPVFAMAEELVGRQQLSASGNPGPALIYPSGDNDWTLPDGGHLDGYYTPTNGVPEGTVGSFHVGTTIYVADVAPRGGGFVVWPGSHRIAHEYFKTHSLLSVVGGTSRTLFAGLDQPPQPLEVTGPAGTVCFWHGQLVHSGSVNCARDIRMALIARLSRRDLDDIRFETPDNMWTHWEGIRS